MILAQAEALRAAALVGTIAIFPSFPSEEGKPTDFNDMHVLYGLDNLKLYFKKLLAGSKPTFRALGFDGITHYWFMEATRSIVAMTSYPEERIYTLMDRAEVLRRFPFGKGDKIHWSEVKNFLVQQQLRAGPYRPSHIRGMGVWKDGNSYIFNANNGLNKDPPTKNHCYVASARNVEPLAQEATDDDFSTLREGLSIVKTSRAELRLLSGWLILARVAAALDVRPHLWLTGGSGSGKSTLMNKLIVPFLGTGAVKFEGGTSSAGIRQTLGHDSLAILFDEYEDPQDSKRIQELMRISWSGGAIVKGTQGGIAMEYGCHSSFLLSSERVHFETTANENRFCVVNLLKSQDPLPAEKLSPITEKLGNRIFARVFSALTIIQNNARTLRLALLKLGLSARRSDQIGTLLAGYSFLMNPSLEPMSVEDAERLVRSHLADSQEIEESTHPEKDDAYLCLQHLLCSQVQVSRTQSSFGNIQLERISILELFQEAGNFPHGDEANKLLQRYGLKRIKDRLCVCYRHPELAKLYAETHWKSWGKSLIRLEGAENLTIKLFDEPKYSVSVISPTS